MKYPEHLLPQKEYKCIDGDISEFYLIRFIPSKHKDDYWDEDTDTINVRRICSPRENIYDLSTNLLGIYKKDDIYIELTIEGKEIYNHYCECDEVIQGIPVYEEHFELEKERPFFFMKIGDIIDRQASYENPVSRIEYVGNSEVKHTPMKWNFWHFSIRWDIAPEEGFSKNMQRRLADEARATIAHFCKKEVKSFPIIAQEAYHKEDHVN